MMSFSPSTPLPQSKTLKRLSFDTSASPLFSPSAAARYAEQTEQWNQVDKWLARVFFPNRVPEFERTEETLSYLHDLSSMSTQRTKEKQALLFAQERTVEEYKQRVRDTDIQLNNVGIEHASLDTKTIELLDELVQVGMVLHVDPSNANVFDIAKGLSDQIDEEQELELRMHEIETLKISLEKDLGDVTVLKGQLEQAQRNQEARQDTLDEKISEWTRGIKLLQAKTEEYESRATNSKAIPGDIRINRLVAKEEKVVKLKEKVAEIQKRVDGYAMLPTDEKGAKREVEKLRVELERLRRKRDAMWEDATRG